MNLHNNIDKVTAESIKTSIDENDSLSPLGKLIDKSIVSSKISDPIDREEAIQCDIIDYKRDCIHCGISGTDFDTSDCHESIEQAAILRKAQIHAEAEQLRQFQRQGKVHQYPWF